MLGELSYDLVMDDDVEFVEGSYRLQDGDWHVFIISKRPVERVEIKSSQWASGVSGLFIRIPLSMKLNKQVVEQLMSEQLKVGAWHEVRGPDSMQLR